MKLSGTWWIDEPQLLAGRNPTHADLENLRAQRFSVMVSFLSAEEHSRYHQRTVMRGGWSVYQLPVPEGQSPSLQQLNEFMEIARSRTGDTKVFVHCESGRGRSAVAGAAYWIAKGQSVEEAIGRVRAGGVQRDWETDERKALLREWQKTRSDQKWNA